MNTQAVEMPDTLTEHDLYDPEVEQYSAHLGPDTCDVVPEGDSSVGLEEFYHCQTHNKAVSRARARDLTADYGYPVCFRWEAQE